MDNTYVICSVICRQNNSSMAYLKEYLFSCTELDETSLPLLYLSTKYVAAATSARVVITSYGFIIGYVLDALSLC